MRNRNTVKFIGLWETLHNPDFKPVEFDTFRKNPTIAHGFNRGIKYTMGNKPFQRFKQCAD